MSSSPRFLVRWGRWSWSGIKWLGRFVSKTEMPIWLSVSLVIAAAIGTYVFAPKVNQTFEFQKNRSQHILSSLNDLNGAIIELSVAVRKYNDSLFYSRNDATDRRGDVLDKITELQWRLIDASVIMRRSGGSGRPLEQLKDRLSELRAVIIEARRPEDQELVIRHHNAVSNAARTAIIALYTAANLR